MNMVDIEEIAARRYYRGVNDDFFCVESEVIECLIDKDVYKEYKVLSEQFGCDEAEDLIHMVLLEWLNKTNL